MGAGDEGEDAIVALATPQGIGALAVVRISGNSAGQVAERLLRGCVGAERRAQLRTIYDSTGRVIDEAVVIWYGGPRSYTGDDTMEVMCHGGRVTPVRIVAAAVDAGARPARAGEFTRRAVLNGRLDLLQAQAIDDLIRSESSGAADLALDQLDGGLSRRVEELRAAVLRLESSIAYEIDFPEEDDPPASAETEAQFEAAVNGVKSLMATFPRGELIRHGALVVIAGAPNVGKSSLFNAILGRRRALVSEVAGTTRDALEAVVDEGPIPLRLVDTAGLREGSDAIEQMGVEVSREYLQRADVVLACTDDVARIADVVGVMQRESPGLVLGIRTKADLAVGREQAGTAALEYRCVSAVTGEGVEQMLADLSARLLDRAGAPDADMPVVAHSRYRHILRRALEELEAFGHARKEGILPAVVQAVHLRESVRQLESLIGTVDVEDILDSVFQRFCVGK